MKLLIVILAVAALLICGVVFLVAAPYGAQQGILLSPQRAPLAPAPIQVGHASSTIGAGAQPATTTPTVGVPVATPKMIVAATATAVTVTVQITDPTLIPGSVNLLLLEASGTQPTVLGTMPSIGNGTYELRYTFNQATPELLELQVSAAFRGLLKRTLSPILTLPVWGAFTDQFTNIHIVFPPLTGTQTQIASEQPTNGAITNLSIQAQDTSTQLFMDVAGVGIYPNTGALTLQQWFENNVDVNSILLNANTFHATTLPNGISALVLSGPVPPAFLNLSGPVDQVYALSPNAQYVITFTGAQEAQLSDYGYNSTTTFIAMLKLMQFN